MSKREGGKHWSNANLSLDLSFNGIVKFCDCPNELIFRNMQTNCATIKLLPNASTLTVKSCFIKVPERTLAARERHFTNLLGETIGLKYIQWGDINV